MHTVTESNETKFYIGQKVRYLPHIKSRPENWLGVCTVLETNVSSVPGHIIIQDSEGNGALHEYSFNMEPA